MVYFTVAAEFNAIHRLWNEDFDEAENIRVFAECANPSGHGHRYRIEVTFASEVSAERPFVVERGTVRKLIESVLAPKLQNANLDTTFGVDGFISTGENVTKAIWKILAEHIPADVSLTAVRVIETPKNSFAYFGKDADREVRMA